MTEQELIWSAVVAWMASKGFERAKSIAWLPVDFTTERLNLWASRLIALAAAVGLHATFNPDAGTLIIDGLTVGGIMGAIGEYAKQLMLQQIFYKKVVKGGAA